MEVIRGGCARQNGAGDAVAAASEEFRGSTPPHLVSVCRLPTANSGLHKDMLLNETVTRCVRGLQYIVRRFRLAHGVILNAGVVGTSTAGKGKRMFCVIGLRRKDLARIYVSS